MQHHSPYLRLSTKKGRNMISRNTLTLLMIPIVLLAMTSCQDDCERTVTYTMWEPEYMSYEEMRSAIQAESPRELINPGKIYYKDGYIFISEVNEGIHVINNFDPSNPINEKFIRIPGNTDLSIKGSALYANSHVDLVTLDIQDLNNVVEVDREEDILPYMATFNGFWADASQGVVKKWNAREVTETIECNRSRGFPFNLFASTDDLAVPETSAADGSTGVGGSLARFTISKNHLYAVTDQDLVVFNLSNDYDPALVNTVNIGWAIETIFPFQGNLLIGSQFGMYIYSLDDASAPRQLSQFEHLRSCDPVVAEGHHAFVTLRSGNMCRDGVNQLDVLDISDLESPRLINSFPMTNPHGLGIKNGTLFICEADAGLKVYDATEILADESLLLPEIAKFPNIHAFDVIPLFNVLLLVGEDGFYQYDFSDPENITQLSHIAVFKD